MNTLPVNLTAPGAQFASGMNHGVNTNYAAFVRYGWWLVLGGFGSFMLWASFAPLDKGVPMSGTVTVETNRKAVQHETGGTVEAILVKEGDSVKAGDILVRMNNVRATSEAEMSRVQYFTARSAEARLLAERKGAKTIEFPAELKNNRDDPRIAESIALQEQLFMSRRAAIQNELASIDENIAGLTIQNSGLTESLRNKQQQLGFIKEQLGSMRALTNAGFVSRTRLLDTEQSYVQINSSIAQDNGNLGRGTRQVAELRLKRQQRMDEYQKEVRAQLSDMQREAASLGNRLSELDHNLKNVQIKASVDGTVIGMNVFTQGAVVAPGFRLMDIVPRDDLLVVEGRLPVHLIDKVQTELDVELIFSAFNQNQTPRIPGVVTQVSADRLVDDRSGEPYYKLLARVTPDGMKKIGNLKVRAGMPVDLFVKTGERTMMNYLLKPLIDHFKMAMTEE